MRIAAIISVAMFCFGCASLGGGRSTWNRGFETSPPPGAALKQAADVQALAALVTQLQTELNGIKSGRDSYAGLTYQSALPLGMAALLAMWIMTRCLETVVDELCEYKVRMAEIAKNGQGHCKWGQA